MASYSALKKSKSLEKNDIRQESNLQDAALNSQEVGDLQCF